MSPALTPAVWDEELARRSQPPPLAQSWGYGEVQAREGWHVKRVDLGRCVAQVQLQGTGPTRWAYVPRGPVPAGEEELKALVEWARSEHLCRLRVEPEATGDFAEVATAVGFGPHPSFQPQHTMIVKLGPEDEMLASFKTKHRYNVRLSLRKGVEVEETDDAEELERQHAHTARRQGIRPPTVAHYRRRLELLPWCRVYVARVEGEAVAAIMVARFGGRAYYLFGGSSERHRQLMPSYAVQWTAMRAAAAAGCVDYDLWGVPPNGDDPNHPWHGLWQMKAGFNGTFVEYAGAWDLVLSPLRVLLGEGVHKTGKALTMLVKKR